MGLIRWRVRDGSTINAWVDPWFRDEAYFKIKTPVILELFDKMVKDLMIPRCLQWDAEAPFSS